MELSFSYFESCKMSLERSPIHAWITVPNEPSRVHIDVFGYRRVKRFIAFVIIRIMNLLSLSIAYIAIGRPQPWNLNFGVHSTTFNYGYSISSYCLITMKTTTLFVPAVLAGIASAVPHLLNSNSTNTSQPFTPEGGLGTNGSLPVYAPLSDFDFQSIVRSNSGLRS